MKVMFITHRPPNILPGRLNFNYACEKDWFEHEVKFLCYGEGRMGYRPDVIILLEPPLDVREEEWLRYTKHCVTPSAIYINPMGKVVEPYGEEANVYI